MTHTMLKNALMDTSLHLGTKIAVNDDLLVESDFTEKSVRTNARTARKGKQPKAVLQRTMKWLYMRAAKEHGINIPEDMKLVGFDDIHMAELMIPRLTTISHQKTGMGELAAQTLIDALNGEKTWKNYASTN
ncbi:substrate-binding domain-containing protein [Vibrio taketomensis]|uniref:substrate-binding domain-containing protein n=1 Tax=Vibrio taketomensis TaxID=2572923 RepID=UPI001E4CB4B6|nr:substrate-binding domain-containing protein [Vibrio taketomensis]